MHLVVPFRRLNVPPWSTCIPDSFSLTPPLPVIPTGKSSLIATRSNGNFQYLNLKGFSLPHGIGMGGTTEAFRFFLPEALDGTCVGRSACLTFEQGELCPHSSRHFELDSIEVRARRTNAVLLTTLIHSHRCFPYIKLYIKIETKYSTKYFDNHFETRLRFTYKTLGLETNWARNRLTCSKRCLDLYIGCSINRRFGT